MRRTLALTVCLVSLLMPTMAEGAMRQKMTIKQERMLIVRAAKSYLGVRYLWGGTSRAGVDCSGLVQLAFKKAGLRLPRTTWMQIEEGVRVSSKRLVKADLVFFSGGGHVAIYLGDGMIIHAPYSGSRVKVERLRRAVYEARRILT